jgi:hypothetical protein
MKTILFKSQFADLVRSGSKRQTIRPVRRNPVKSGEVVALRRWEGAAYRTKRIDLCTATIESVTPILIDDAGLKIGHERITDLVALHAEAIADGFADWQEMVAWFEAVHGLPFYGVLIKWAPRLAEQPKANPAYQAPYADA